MPYHSPSAYLGLKMLALSVFLIAGLLPTAAAQQIPLADSIKIMLAQDTTVLRYTYHETNHKNGQKKEEGWYYVSHYESRVKSQWTEKTFLHRIGFWKFYRKDGSIKKTEFLPRSDKDQLTMKNYTKSGQLRMVRELIPAENEKANRSMGKGSFDGIMLLNRLSVIIYYKNGQVQRTYSQVGLKNVDNYIVYHQNGQMSIKKYYNENFKLDGPYATWAENGQQLIQGQYANGEKTGGWKWYNAKGRLKREKTY